MPQEYITAEEHSKRRQGLEQELAAAGSSLDEALERDDDGEGAREPRWNVEHLELRLDALDRVRARSVAQEQRQAELAQEEQDRQEIAKVLALAEVARAAAVNSEESFQAFLSDVREANEAWIGFDSTIKALVLGRLGFDHPRMQAISLALSHRFEGSTIVGRLQAAAVPGLELVDDPIDAMRQCAGYTLSSLVSTRIDTVMRRASIDIPELRASERDALQDSENESEGATVDA